MWEVKNKPSIHLDWFLLVGRWSPPDLKFKKKNWNALKDKLFLLKILTICVEGTKKNGWNISDLHTKSNVGIGIFVAWKKNGELLVIFNNIDPLLILYQKKWTHSVLFCTWPRSIFILCGGGTDIVNFHLRTQCEFYKKYVICMYVPSNDRYIEDDKMLWNKECPN